MSTLVPVCPGQITVDQTGALLCSESWQTMVSPVGFDFSQIDPALMATAAGAGFSVSITLMAFAWGGRIIYKSITKGE
jgi:hypothetical protein